MLATQTIYEVEPVMQHIHFGRYYGTFYRKTMLFMREGFRPLGLTFTEGIMLVMICKSPGVIQEEIANRLAIDKAAAARAVKKLEEAGLAERRADPKNLRVKKVFPTRKAKPVKKRIDQVVNRWNEIAFSGFSDEQQENIVLGLHQIRDRSLEADIAAEVAKLYEEKL
jgi:DNA-binding MarR family transcriptional regulator